MNIAKQLGNVAKMARSGKTSLLVSIAVILLAIGLLMAFPLIALWALNLLGANIPITWKTWAGALLLWAFLKITLNANQSKD